MIIGQVVFSTSPQEHYFDCPYQLSSESVGQTFLDATVLNLIIHHIIIYRLRIQLDYLDGKKVKPLYCLCCDEMQVISVELMEEDTIVMGSDGLFDNVYDREILSVVDSCDNVCDAGML